MNDMSNLKDLEVGYDVPALPGMDEADIATPCLVLDLDALERNIKKMGDFAKSHGMRHRVHGKMHKSVDVALLQEKLGGKIGISARIMEVQETFGKIFNEGTDFQRDGSQFDALFQDGDRYKVGEVDAFVMATPGHTPACMVHVMGNAAFTGDTIFMPDGGSARADFPGGDAGELYDSIQKVLTLPDDMRLYMCHDYGPNGRDIAWETTVADEKAHNVHVGGDAGREAFVKLRSERDATLAMPKLIIPSLQVNMRAGEVPKDVDGRPVLKVPLNQL